MLLHAVRGRCCGIDAGMSLHAGSIVIPLLVGGICETLCRLTATMCWDQPSEVISRDKLLREELSCSNKSLSCDIQVCSHQPGRRSVRCLICRSDQAAIFEATPGSHVSLS